MAQPEYRAAIVGLSWMGAQRPKAQAPGAPLYGQSPRSHAAAFQVHPRTQVAAVCDIRPQALEDFQREWADVWPDVRMYTGYAEMFEREQPDIASIVTPDNLHLGPTLAAVENGARAVFCEKPLATSVKDADRMIAACEARGVLLSVDHTRRWDPKYHQARELVRGGSLGPLRAIYAPTHHPRAMLFRDHSHAIDMACFFAEAEPAWLVAELEDGYDDYWEYRGDGGRDPRTDPAASIFVRYRNGVRAFVSGMKTRRGRYQFELVCDEGLIEVSDVGLNVITISDDWQWSSSPRLAEEYAGAYQAAAVAELVQALDSGRGDLVCSGREALKTVEIMAGAMRSHAQGNVRVNLPLAR
jgi:predicted dehydrogenase